MKTFGHSLSNRQTRIIEFIRDYRTEHGYPPTMREIGRAVDISSTSVVDYNLNALEKMNLLRRDREISRGIELVGDEPEAIEPSVTIPIIGQIAAGSPIEAIDGIRETLALSPSFAPPGAYALRVKGRSMIDDLIDDGDLVIIKPQPTAENGEIVVALIQDPETPEGVVTLKRLYRERTRVRLQPRNPDMDPIYVDPTHLRIQGKVVSVIRRIA
jgi:repressor LexA